jgi:hypothetical protein
MVKYEELSEKERFLKEILRSARLITGKRELCRGALSNQIIEKGGLKRDERERREEKTINA